jgi:hypothetical protein
VRSFRRDWYQPEIDFQAAAHRSFPNPQRLL